MFLTWRDTEVVITCLLYTSSNPGFEGAVVVDGMLKVGVDQVGGGNANAFDANEIIDLTDKVVLNDDNRTGTLEWTAPSDGNYLVMYYWQQGTAQASSPATIPSYCINSVSYTHRDVYKRQV